MPPALGLLVLGEQLARRSPSRLTFIIDVRNLLTVGVTHDENLVSIGVSKHCANRVSTNPHNLEAATKPNSVNIRSCGLPTTLYVSLYADNSISCSSGI